jgi:hypothetical protein
MHENKVLEALFIFELVPNNMIWALIQIYY